MKLRIIAIAGILLIIGVLLVYFFVYNKPHPDYERLQAEYHYPADVFFNEFQQDPDEAQRKYNGRMIRVDGVLDDIQTPEGMVVLVFNFEEGLFGPEGIRASLLDSYHEQARDMNTGHMVSVKGYCAGFDGSVILQHSSFETIPD
jgi:hypothetical protein